MFPLKPSQDTHSVRRRKKFLVNLSHTERYIKSTIPYLQKQLNSYTEKLKIGDINKWSKCKKVENKQGTPPRTVY